MSDLKLAFTYLKSRLLITALTVASVSLGLALASIVLIMEQETRETLRHETAHWDLVVGAKGSPLQLVLNSLYYLDAPTGNIPATLWEDLEENEIVARVVPVSQGDTYYGAPIVGTTPAFFDHRFGATDDLLAAGRFFAAPFEAVVGADVARRHGLKVGQQIVGSHGWAADGDMHDDDPYTVVGILKAGGVSIDRAVFTDYHSVWAVHAHHDHDDDHAHAAPQDDDDEHVDGDHHVHGPGCEDEHGHDDMPLAAIDGHDQHDELDGREVTALLVRLTQSGRRYQFAQQVNAHQPAMAVIPVDEISKLTTTFLVPMQRVLLLVAYLVVLVSALSILISLYLTIHQRRRDVAILRALGATRGDVFRLITLEAATLAGLGVILGLLLGHALVAALAPFTLAQFGIAPNAWHIQPLEIIVAASVWALGILAGLLPAITAYRLPVADTLTTE